MSSSRAICLYDHIQHLLASHAPAKRTAAEVAAELGVPLRSVLTSVIVLIDRQLVLREEIHVDGLLRFAYYMTDDQCAAFAVVWEVKQQVKSRSKKAVPGLPSCGAEEGQAKSVPEEKMPKSIPEAKQAKRVPAKPKAPPPWQPPRWLADPVRCEGVLQMAQLEATNCQQRLKFLYHLRDKTIFSDWQLLHECIADYEHTLKKLLR